MVKRSATSKFPIARIKRIMQADEDVGKVAQATPVVISKALELFMQDIVASAVEQTRKTGGKRVAPYHLKRAALTIETFDFLKDIVEKVADPLESGGAARSTKRRKVAKAEEADEASADDSAE
ncbi:dna polymerase epsilon subunit dpb3 [Malassezia pachydermatis]|uniref:Dna polymerase epsilon subunit dpb3 n=1 Tax=Malassezia pachydermatis TaxID=77020 RepID=A0A0M8MNX7_9BASI|nr:dna polymerase epsilon subunit dpb3 [Malassezia pachydermatis]KOS15368.1 dna polymerase epsilon subunit dpb3 [Malassezia pachydermatis]